MAEGTRTGGVASSCEEGSGASRPEESTTIVVTCSLSGEEVVRLPGSTGDETLGQLKRRLHAEERASVSNDGKRSRCSSSNNGSILGTGGTPVFAQRLWLEGSSELLWLDAPVADSRSLGSLCSLLQHQPELRLQLVRLPLDQNLTVALLHAVEFAVEHHDLFEAATSNIRALLQSTADLNGSDADGWSALHEAACVGSAPVCSLLAEACGHVNARSSEGATPLLVAAECGHEEAVAELLKQGANVNAVRSDGASPLLLSVKGCFGEVVTQLQEAGALVNLKEKLQGISPLHEAAEQGCTSIVRQLLAHRAEVNALSKTGITALLLAASAGHLAAVRELLGQKASWSAAEDSMGMTPLLAAARGGHTSVVRALLRQRAEANGTLTDGTSALFLACQEGGGETGTAVVAALLAGRAAVDQAARDGATPLLTAAQHGHLHMLQALISAGASVNSGAVQGATALICASHFGRMEVCRALLQARADPKRAARDNALLGSGSAVEVAGRAGHLQIVELVARGSFQNMDSL